MVLSLHIESHPVTKATQLLLFRFRAYTSCFNSRQTNMKGYIICEVKTSPVLGKIRGCE